MGDDRGQAAVTGREKKDDPGVDDESGGADDREHENHVPTVNPVDAESDRVVQAQEIQRPHLGCDKDDDERPVDDEEDGGGDEPRPEAPRQASGPE